MSAEYPETRLERMILFDEEIISTSRSVSYRKAGDMRNMREQDTGSQDTILSHG